MKIVESSKYTQLVYTLKLKDVKRQYPLSCLISFFDFIKIEEESIEQKCKFFYDFASKVENKKILETQLFKLKGNGYIYRQIFHNILLEKYRIKINFNRLGQLF